MHHVPEWRKCPVGKVATTKANFSHKSFIETVFSHGNDANKTLLACQGYFYEDSPSGIDGASG